MKKFFKEFFSMRWELFHTTANVDQHFSKLEELRNSGIDFKTKGLNFGGGYGGGSGFSTVYHIYVKKRIIYKSKEAN